MSIEDSLALSNIFTQRLWSTIPNNCRWNILQLHSARQNQLFHGGFVDKRIAVDALHKASECDCFAHLWMCKREFVMSIPKDMNNISEVSRPRIRGNGPCSCHADRRVAKRFQKSTD